MPSKAKPVRSPGENRHVALLYFELGRQLNEKRAALRVEGKRLSEEERDKEFRSLAENVGLNIPPKRGTDIRFKAMELAKRFESNQPDLSELCAIQNGGVHLTVSHIIELMRIPNARARRRLAKLAVKAKLSCVRLRAEVRNQAGWQSDRKGSVRPPEEPRSEAHAIIRVNREAKALKMTLEWLQTHSNQNCEFKMNEFWPHIEKSVESLRKVMQGIMKSRKDLQTASSVSIGRNEIANGNQTTLSSMKVSD
jgi:hypothetical protein